MLKAVKTLITNTKIANFRRALQILGDFAILNSE